MKAKKLRGQEKGCKLDCDPYHIRSGSTDADPVFVDDLHLSAARKRIYEAAAELSADSV